MRDERPVRLVGGDAAVGPDRVAAPNAFRAAPTDEQDGDRERKRADAGSRSVPETRNPRKLDRIASAGETCWPHDPPVEPAGGNDP